MTHDAGSMAVQEFAGYEADLRLGGRSDGLGGERQGALRQRATHAGQKGPRPTRRIGAGFDELWREREQVRLTETESMHTKAPRFGSALLFQGTKVDLIWFECNNRYCE